MKDKGEHTSLCNCKIKKECPMGRKCNSENIVYQANIFPIESKNDEKVYIDISTLNCITIDILLLIYYLKINQLYLSIIGVKNCGLTPQIK